MNKTYKKLRYVTHNVNKLCPDKPYSLWKTLWKMFKTLFIS